MADPKTMEVPQIVVTMEGPQTSKMKELKGTEKRDSLVAIEKKYQKEWQDQGIFNVDAPTTTEIPLHSVPASELRASQPKWFGTMAYPYMNGTLHAGHAFSISKVEFAAGVARMRGKRALFPMGYHCTGMPIQASADKLVDEIKRFGPEFENFKPEDDAAAAEETQPADPKEDVTKFTSKKAKVAQKTGGKKFQFQILQSIGIPTQEIHRFSDPQYWLQYFPPQAISDLNAFGARIDWRRTFVTTDANPYYDSFVRWQMVRLKELGKIKFGKRHSIYSLKDGQPCMDHDRSEGEGAGPQEYTAVKLKVLEWSPRARAAIETANLPAGASVYLVPATLRPETMYGQTCCFVGPKVTYGVFKVKENEYYVVTDRAATNMSHQDIFATKGVAEKACDIVGSDMVGTLVHAPLSVHKDGVRVLPMESVLPTKGTGVVTSVPSDSPDDYATVIELAKKADYYGIEKEWAELKIVPIVDTPSYGDLCAPFLVKQMKIGSPKDTKQLAEAKELAYKEGYFHGTMLVGPFKGQKVEVAKPLIASMLSYAGQAFVYSEPERRVVSRSGDECIVALTDQWYLDYADDIWTQTALDWVDGMETWGEETRNGYQSALRWLQEHPCARSYGLGTRLPWDPQFLVESLSDSTIYMSYYTIAHYLHRDLYGREPGIGNVTPDQMTNEVWDYIFCRRDLGDDVLAGSQIPAATLESMRREFEYFYPLDMRSSAKDLLTNHLLYFMYCHVALFPQEYWPRGVRINGHLMMNREKMSKSTGNFLTLRDMVSKYGADAARMALADAGDGGSDGNLEEDVADACVVRLYKLREWVEETVAAKDKLRTGELNSFQDALFDNEMNGLAREAMAHYDNTDFKLALKSGFYDFTAARDFYRETCSAAGMSMHRDLALKFIEWQALLIAVVAPHWAEHVWLEVLKKDRSIQQATFPDVPAVDPALSAAREYVRNTASSINAAESQQIKKKAKGKEVSFDPRKPKHLIIFISDVFPQWQEKYVQLLQKHWDPAAKSVRDEKALLEQISQKSQTWGKAEMTKGMQLVQALKKRLLAGESEEAVLERKLGFSERETLKHMIPSLTKTTGVVGIMVMVVKGQGKRATDISDCHSHDLVPQLQQAAEGAVPGAPTFFFDNVIYPKEAKEEAKEAEKKAAGEGKSNKQEQGGEEKKSKQEEGG